MTDPTDEPQKPNVHANHNSIAVGSISAGGDISGNIHIGNIYQTPEDDLPLSSDEIENGLTRFAQFLSERAPVLQDSFSSIAKKLRTTLGANQNSLSPTLKNQREETLGVMKPMCMEVMDISFRAICLGQNPPPYDSRPPFLGLFAFRPEDREFFFGRDALVQKLVARIKAHPFLAVLGASGSGKSSLVMAGLVPVLEAQMSYLTPSSAPLSQLLTAKKSASAKTVFVIDQFEELFTHPHDDAERADFIQALLELTKTNRVVITMRADFWGEVAIYSDLKHAMQEHQELIAPMTVDELHSAMEKQAAVVGLRFDPTLSESILVEVKGEPGAMPLLQHALWELWNRRHGLWIKAEEYQAFGGVKQAIASTAEEVYASCSDFERARVRDIFLRLTRLDESGEGRDTRRRVLIEELIPVNSDSSVTINLLNKLADARLIVKTDKDVEVAHEALIRHWSRLTEWLNEDRDNLRLREGVSESAREWENSKLDDSLLNHRGGRLELALAMSKLSRYQLNDFEQAYLNACVSLRIKEQRERERRLRYTVIASITAAIIFLILGSFGLIKSNQAINQADIALARQLAAQSQLLYANENSKQQTAVLLAIQSIRIFPSDETVQILQNSKLASLITIMTHDDEVQSVAFSPNGKYVVSGSWDNTARVWVAATGKEITRMTHDSGVYSVAFSPDGKYVVSGSSDNTARVWDAATGQEITRMTHDSGVYSVAFSPNGKYVVSGSSDGVILVWSTESAREIARMKHNYSVYSVAISPDSMYVISGGCDQGSTSTRSCSKGSARVWDSTTGKEISHMIFDDAVNSVDFSPDSKYVVSASDDETARVWEVETGKEIARMTHGGWVESVDFSPDGKYVISGSVDNTARIWESNTGEEIARMTHNGGVYYVAFSPDGKHAISGSADNTARVWDTATGEETARMTHDELVDSAAFSPDSKYVISGGRDKTVRIWNANTGREFIKKTHDEGVYFVTFSPNDRYVVSAGCDIENSHQSCTQSSIHVLNASTGAEIARTIQGERVSLVAFSPNGKYIVSGSWDNTARVWEVATGKEISRMTHEAGVSSVVFSPNGKYVVSGSWDNTARVWEAATGKEVSRMTHDSGVYSVAFSIDGKYVVSGGCDKYDDSRPSCTQGSARVWEAATGKEISRMVHEGNVYSVAFSPNGKYVVSGSWDNTARVWEAATGKEISRIMHDGFVNSVAFSVDGRYVVSASNDKTARVLEVATGKEIARMTHDDGVYSATFSPNSQYVISGSWDKTARVWEVATSREIAYMRHDGTVTSVAFGLNGKYVISGGGTTTRVWIYLPKDLVANACSRVPRNLTRAEWNQYIGDALPYQAVCPNLPIEAESTPVP
jgi:WD40 repeat protein